MWALFERLGGARRRATPLSRRFTYRYVLAIVIFASIALAAKVSNDRALNALDQNNRQLEAAAQQAPRTYRILQLADDINATNDAEQAKIWASQLEQEADTLSQVQRNLVTGEPTLNLPGVPPNEPLQKLYLATDAENNLRQNVDQVVGAARTVSDFAGPTDQNRQARAGQVALLQSSVPDTADKLGKAVGLYVDKSTSIIDDQRTASTLFILAEVGAVLVVVLLLFRPMARSIHMETSQLEDAERDHRENNERQTFRNDLSQALEVTENDQEVLATVGRALNTVVPENKGELLLADTSQAHLRRSQVHPVLGAARCPVDEPKSCAALRSTQTMVYESSRMLNVCPKLPEHSQAPCSAVCVPVAFNGQALGVLHVIGPDNQPPSHTQIERLGVLASETGARLGTLAVMRMTELQATTDGLTGLLNRRSLEAKARSMLLDQRPFSIAMADLDDFKELNDTYGHESGDRALRAFAKTLRNQLRPDDIASRFGGEEFVVLLPNTSIAEGVRALERLQEALSDEVRRSTHVPFTVSWGLTDTTAGASFEEMLAVADAALYSAKRAGKNCIVVDGEAARAAGELPDDLPQDAIVERLERSGDGQHADPDGDLELDLGLVSDEAEPAT